MTVAVSLTATKSFAAYRRARQTERRHPVRNEKTWWTGFQTGESRDWTISKTWDPPKSLMLSAKSLILNQLWFVKSIRIEQDHTTNQQGPPLAIVICGSQTWTNKSQKVSFSTKLWILGSSLGARGLTFFFRALTLSSWSLLPSADSADSAPAPQTKKTLKLQPPPLIGFGATALNVIHSLFRHYLHPIYFWYVAMLNDQTLIYYEYFTEIQIQRQHF